MTRGMFLLQSMFLTTAVVAIICAWLWVGTWLWTSVGWPVGLGAYLWPFIFAIEVKDDRQREAETVPPDDRRVN
jgi:hypothetical protein